MEATLRELLDKQALHELVLTYCRACDRRDLRLLCSLYHDDAIDDHGSMFKGLPGELYTTADHRTPLPDAREIVIGGRYLDRYERRGGGWTLRHRSLALDWCRAEPVNPTAYGEFAAGAPRGRPDLQDPSYLNLTLLYPDARRPQDGRRHD